MPDVSPWLCKECLGKETRNPCTVSRHTVCTHRRSRALQRALKTLKATCKPHACTRITFCHSPNRVLLFFLLGVRSRCLWLSGETELKSYNCTFSRVRSAIQPTHILAQEESEQGFPLAGTNLTTPLTTVQFSGACSSLSAHSPGTPVSGENWSHQSGIYW